MEEIEQKNEEIKKRKIRPVGRVTGVRLLLLLLRHLSPCLLFFLLRPVPLFLFLLSFLPHFLI